MAASEQMHGSALFEDNQPCPYFSDGRICTIEFLVHNEEDAEQYDDFLDRGYRRIGRVFYRNICIGCSECLPLRLETSEFTLSKSHKRTLKNNEDIRVEIAEDIDITVEKIQLYNKYVNSKHPEESPEEPIDSVNTLMNMHYGYPRTIEMDYFAGSRLIGVGIVDKSASALSSNYFYYDTDYLHRRLGVFSILQEIALARELGKQFYYLGFYIEENPKMSYKKFFRPNQVLQDGSWKDFLSE